MSPAEFSYRKRPVRGRRRLIPLLLGPVVLAGCMTVGPDYRAPDLAPPAAFRNAPAGASVALPEPGQWWMVFGDPALDALERDALAHNPTIAQADANLAAARAQLGVSRADRQPSLSLAETNQFAGEAAQQIIPLNGRTFSYRPTSGDTYDIPLNASYELDLWGRVRREVESSSASLQASQEDLRGAALSLTASLAQDYFQWRTVLVQLDIADRTVASRRDSLAVLVERNRSGLIDALDVASAREQLAQAQAASDDFKRQRNQFEDAIAALAGHAPADFAMPGLSEGDLLSVPVPPAIPAGLPSELLRRRPDVVSAERNLAAQTAQIGVAVAAQFPTIKLTGSGGLSSLGLSTLVSRASALWSLGSSVSLPILDGGRNKATIAQARAHADAALAAYRQQTLTAFREVEDALAGIHWQAEELEADGRAAEAAGETAKLTRIRYQKGLITYLDVANAERDYFAAQNTRAVVAGSQCLSTVALIQALGGGWN